MKQKCKITEKGKQLLTVLGRHPHISMKELLNRTQYKQMSTVVRKVNQFRACNILSGPLYFVDYGKLCRNPLHRLYTIVELTRDYETVISYLALIEPLIWVYPVLSSHKKLLNVGFLSSDDREVADLLTLLKDNNIITDYIFRVRDHERVIENPNFFGDPDPSLDTLLDPCEIPPTSFGEYETVWNECDIRTLAYLQGGYKNMKLTEIVKKERELHKRRWKYEQVRYSYEKMVKNGLIEKKYYIAPFPLDLCADFYLFFRTEDTALTRRMLCNFGRGGRILKEYSLYDEWGAIGCLCHPLFVTRLMRLLDQIDEIKERELYHVRSFPPGMCYVGHYAEFNYYNVETQRLEYPYTMYREKIKEKLEREEL